MMVRGAEGQREQKHTLKPLLIFVPDPKMLFLLVPPVLPTLPVGRKEPGAECEGLFMCMGPRTHFAKKPMIKKD